MAEFMYIPNYNTQIWLQFVVETFGHSTKRTNQLKFNKNPQGCCQLIRKRYYKILGTSVINSLMSPSLPGAYNCVLLIRNEVECFWGSLRLIYIVDAFVSGI